MRTWRCHKAGALIALTTTLATGRSHAGEVEDAGIAFAETFVTRTRLSRPLTVNGEGAPRHLVGLGAPADPMTRAGFGFGLELRGVKIRGSDRLTFRPFELRYAMSLEGSSGAAAANGGTVATHVSAPRVLEIGTSAPLPGFQLVSRAASMKVGFNVSYGLALTSATATMREPNGAVSTGEITRQDFYVRADLSFCRRVRSPLEPLYAWVCVVAEPYVYARDFFSGISGAVRFSL